MLWQMSEIQYLQMDRRKTYWAVEGSWMNVLLYHSLINCCTFAVKVHFSDDPLRLKFNQQGIATLNN